MATTPRRGKPFCWITWITPLASGDAQCQYPAWLKAHFKDVPEFPDDFDLDRWKADHNALVDIRKREFEADGQKVRVENENWLRVAGESALLIGKPDLNAQLGGQFTLADGKTGKQSAKDLWQMWIYLYMLPKAWQNPQLRVTGEVFYGEKNTDGTMRMTTRIAVQPEEFDASRRAEAFAVVRMAGSATPPKKTPSYPECSRCNLVDCEERKADFGASAEDNVAVTSIDF